MINEKWLSEKINDMWHDFQLEMNQEENKDYRRGFRAGCLFAALQIRDDLNKQQEMINE